MVDNRCPSDYNERFPGVSQPIALPMFDRRYHQHDIARLINVCGHHVYMRAYAVGPLSCVTTGLLLLHEIECYKHPLGA